MNRSERDSAADAAIRRMRLYPAWHQIARCTESGLVIDAETISLRPFETPFRYSLKLAHVSMGAIYNSAE